MNAVVIDIEADNLYPYQNNTWTIVLKRISGENLVLHPFLASERWKVKQKILDFLGDNPIVIGHNILGYDMWVLWKDHGLHFHVGKDTICGRPVTFFDTLFASQFLYPDRDGGHSLKSWGERLGNFKIEYRAVALELGIIQPHDRWSEKMDEYCIQDTEVTEQVFNQLHSQIEDMNAFRLGQKNFFLMKAQGFTGFKFDKVEAVRLEKRISQMIANLKAEVEPDLPKRPLKKSEESFYRIPAKPFVKDGGFSSIMQSFIERHNAEIRGNEIRVNGRFIPIIPGNMVIDKLPMSLSDQFELKDYFLSLNWEPTMWNLKKDSRGKPIKENGQVVRTSPKFQESGKICENLLELDGDLPKKIVKFLSLRNRHSILTGWLEHPRLQFDGRLPAGSTGIASTHRQKHTVIVNVPKAQDDVLLGKEFRSLFCVEDGNRLIGVDQAALEARCEAHWTFPFDNGERANLLISKDIHSHNAKIFFPNETRGFDIDSPDFDKDHPGFKQYRSLSKNGGYCLPMHTEVLTDRGWLMFDQLNLNDTVYSYDLTQGKIVKDSIIQKHLLKDREVKQYSNSYYSFECTDDHRWYGWKTLWKNKREYGFFTMGEATREHNLVVAAEFEGGNSNITVLESELVGWILSEGTITWAKESSGPSTSHGKKRGVKLTIAQSEHCFANEIRQLLAELNCDYLEYYKNYGVEGKRIVNFSIRQGWAREFLDRVVGERKNKHDIDWMAWMLGLTSEARKAFLRAFWMGDGVVKNWSSKSLSISQNDGTVSDMLQLGYFMEGRIVTVSKGFKSNSARCRGINISSRGHITCQKINMVSTGIQDTFCLTTNNGTFVVRQNRFMMLTGNCLAYGGGGKKLAQTLRKPEREGTPLYDAYWAANPSLKQLKDKIEYEWETIGYKKWITGIDGRRLYSRSKHSLVNLLFQSTGAIIVDYAVCLFDMKMGNMSLDNLGRPYYIYKGKVVKRVQYFHDEFGCETEPEIAEEVARIMEWSMVEAGKRLKLNIPLVGESKIGLNWAETH